MLPNPIDHAKKGTGSGREENSACPKCPKDDQRMIKEK
jgi:hypothetical protein